MKHFAVIVDGRVVEVIPEFASFDGVDLPLSERYNQAFIETLVPYDPANPPAPPPPQAVSAPQVVTMRQARLALLASGNLAAVTAAIDALPSPQKEKAEIEWEFAVAVERASPLVALLSGVLSLDEAELDALFTSAASL